MAALVGGVAQAASAATAPEAAGTFAPLAAYTNWNVVSFGDVTMSAESEGPVAARGNIAFTGTQVAFRDAANPVGLLTGGGVDWAKSTGTLQVLNGAGIRIGDLSTSSVHTTDDNGAAMNTALVPAGAGPSASPSVRTTVHEPAADAAAPGLFDSTFSQADAIATSRAVAAAVNGGCESVATLSPIVAGAVQLDLRPGVNVWTVSAADLSTVRSITFAGQAPSPADPLVINVTGGGELTLSLTMAGTRDPQGILINAPDATSIDQSGDSIDGSILAPVAAYTKTSSNVQGTVVVGSAVLGGSEEHYFPFLGRIPDCVSAAPTPTPTPTPTASVTPAPGPATSGSGSGTSTSQPGVPTPTADPGGSSTSEGASSGRPSTSLADTGGANPALPIALGGVLVLAGLVMLSVVRRGAHPGSAR
jgi:choice-of-anchor A domain-containing protein